MIYQVTVRTQLGERRGRVELQRAQSALTGALFFLGKETPLRGTVAAAGWRAPFRRCCVPLPSRRRVIWRAAAWS